MSTGVDYRAGMTASRAGHPLGLRGVLISLLLVVEACGAPAVSTPPRVGADILVGAALSLTGPLGQEGLLAQQGYQMWRPG